MPKLEEDIRAKNKAIREKTKSPSAGKSSPTVRSTNKLFQTIQLIKQTASKRLQSEEGKYQLIRTEEDLIEYTDRVIDNGIAGLDTETTGLDPIVNHLVGTCLYTPGQKGCYIPHKHIDTSGKPIPDQISYEVMSEQFKRMVDAGVKFIFHNAKFDIRVVFNWTGVWIKPFWDTALAGNFLNENEPHGLKYLHDKYVLGNPKQDEELNTFNSLFEGITFDYVPIEIGYLYAAKDPKITFELYEFQLPYLTPENEACKRQKLEEAAKLYRDIEVPLIPYLAEMEEEGVYVNEEIAEQLGVEYRDQMRTAATNAIKCIQQFDFSSLPADKRSKLSGPIEIGENDYLESSVNIGSPTQMAIVLYDVLKVKSPDAKSPRGTGEEILETISSRTEDETVKELLKYILEFRKAKKLLGTYIEKMPKIVKEKTGRLHGQFNQVGAKTGRMSSKDPNLQNIPSKGKTKRIRTIFGPGEGYVFVGSDFSYPKVG